MPVYENSVDENLPRSSAAAVLKSTGKQGLDDFAMHSKQMVGRAVVRSRPSMSARRQRQPWN